MSPSKPRLKQLAEEARKISAIERRDNAELVAEAAMWEANANEWRRKLAVAEAALRLCEAAIGPLHLGPGSAAGIAYRAARAALAPAESSSAHTQPRRDLGSEHEDALNSGGTKEAP